MIAGTYPVAFALDGAAKDADLILAAAAAAGLRMDITDVTRRNLASASERGHGADDMAAIFVATVRPADQRRLTSAASGASLRCR